VVENYLRRTFPGCEVEQEYYVGKSQYLRIREAPQLRHRVLVVHGFIDDSTEEEILALLTEWRAGQEIQIAGAALVLITNHGVR
jgi:hypothetical protein